MKQIIQYQKTGEMKVAELEMPKCRNGWILVRNMASAISAGTEKTSVETASASMLGKAKSRPDLVKQVLDTAKKEGFKATWDKVQNRLDNYKELGYSCAGVVVESGSEEFRVGDRVACAGGTANHSEYVLVPQNLCVIIPEGVDFDEAAFTTIGAIAMQGVRQADLRVGENAVVVGLGLIGLITVQILKASGCRVLVTDVNDSNFSIAKNLGCDVCIISGEDSLKIVESFSNGYGTDAVIITAGTKSNEPVEYAMKYVRKRGKVVIVGAVGMNIPRAGFYEKEVDFKISCSYGPGRYDLNYEEKGMDYPYGFVRWTERRNMSSILDLMESGGLDIKSLITHKIDISDGLRAYDIITGKVKERFIGIVIKYGDEVMKESDDVMKESFSRESHEKEHKNLNRVSELMSKKVKRVEKVKVGFVGAGNFAQSNLIPNLKGADLIGVATGKGVNADSVKNKFGFNYGTTDADKIFKNENINTVFVASRHDSHGKYVIDALKAGKHVFVEKPLAIQNSELRIMNEILREQNGKEELHLQVGFNRRFSQPIIDVKNFFKDDSEPKVIYYRVNAGFIPKSSWIQDKDQGGRIVGEGCHFIDVMQYLTNAKPIKFSASMIRSNNTETKNKDNVSITIDFSDGSVGTLIYSANGSSKLDKEYCEVFCGGKSAVMNNFKTVSLYTGSKSIVKKYNGTKGHKEEIIHFMNVLTGNENPGLSFEDMYLNTLLTINIEEYLSGNV